MSMCSLYIYILVETYKHIHTYFDYVRVCMYHLCIQWHAQNLRFVFHQGLFLSTAPLSFQSNAENNQES